MTICRPDWSASRAIGWLGDTMNAIQAMVRQMQHARPTPTVRQKSAYDRILAVERVEAGESRLSVANSLGYGETTVRRWVQQARKERQK
jgi:hypothetical protein